MAQPVWVLSVDLQTKTATFQSGLSDAAKSARGAFSDIKGGASGMGDSVSYSMTEARHSVMLLGEEFGIHLPRALTSFIAGLGPIGPALEMAFPFLAIIAGATLLIEHLVKLREAGVQLTTDQMKFGTVVNDVFNQLDDKLLQAQIRADDLAHNHLGALQKQLELIDHESMNELVHSFEEVAKAGDVVMKELEGHWYTFGQGSEGAKHALDDFQAHYALLLSTHKDADASKASGLLGGTLAQAQKTLDLLKQLQSAGRSNAFGAFADPEKFHQAEDALKQMGIAHTETVEKQIEAQQNLVDILNAQVGAEQRIATIKSLEGGNVKTADAQADTRYAQEQQRKLDEALKAGRSAYLTGLIETYKQTVSAIQQGERENIDATKQGTAQRLQAIEDAMHREEADGLQGTAFYRELQISRIETQRQMDEEAKKQAQEAASENIRQDQAMSELRLAAVRAADELQLSTMHNSQLQRLADEQKAADEEYGIKLRALEQEAAVLDKSDADYTNKLRELQNKEIQLVQQHENQITAIKQKAEEERNTRILSAFTRFQDTIASGLTKSIMGHETWAKMVTDLGDQVVSGMIENAIKSMIAEDMTKDRDAAKAARDAWNATGAIPVVGPFMAPAAAAGAFAAVMAFAGGGRVPGVGNMDSVPSVLTPGETVVDKDLTNRLDRATRDGTLGGDVHNHIHVRPTYHVNTIDGDGMQDALEKHTDQLQRHFESAVRRTNRG